MLYKKGDKIDLHIHSKYSSDGKFPIKELLQMAQEQKLKTISFTDHNTLDAYDELKTFDTKKYFKGNIITGVEINVMYDGNLVEVLAYNFDVEKLKEFWFLKPENMMRVQKEASETVAKKYRSMGVKMGKAFINKITTNGAYAIYEEIINHKQNLWFLKKCKITHYGYFYRKVMLNKKHKYYVDLSAHFPSMEEVHKAVNEAGGVTILAHPFGQYAIQFNKAFIRKVIKNKAVDGLECIHRNITRRESLYLLRLCDENNLIKTAGSDFHRIGHMMGKSKKSGMDTIIY